MFKFVQSPFEDEVKKAIEKCTLRTCHAAIVWESTKGVRLITASSASEPERQLFKISQMENWFAKLHSGALSEIKQTLRVIIRANTPKPKPRPFFHSFKGHGGSGVDGIW